MRIRLPLRAPAIDLSLPLRRVAARALPARPPRLVCMDESRRDHATTVFRAETAFFCRRRPLVPELVRGPVYRSGPFV